MAQKKFSGVIRIHRRATLMTEERTFILNPFPPGITKPSISEQEDEGKKMFNYLKQKEATISGELSDNVLFNARVFCKRIIKISGEEFAPEKDDRLSKDIEKFFKKDYQQIASKLNDINITNVSALYHRIKNSDAEISAFSKYLGVPESAIIRFLKAIEAADKNHSVTTAPPKDPVTQGARERGLSPTHRSANKQSSDFPRSAITSKLPSEVDLTSKITRVKDQGARATTVAFVVTALLEYELINMGAYSKSLDLSEQYLYWACKQIDGAPNYEGTFIEHAMKVLKNGLRSKRLAPGICMEKDWPYANWTISENESHDPPPKKALLARKYGIVNYKKLNPKSVQDLKTALADNHCVALSLFIYHFWVDGFAWATGQISVPFQVNPNGAHAICLVGYKDNDASHSDGDFIFKNSWGTNWGVQRPDKGFGSLPYQYVIQNGIEAFIIEPWV